MLVKVSRSEAKSFVEQLRNVVLHLLMVEQAKSSG